MIRRLLNGALLLTLVIAPLLPAFNTPSRTPVAHAVEYTPLNNNRPKDFAIIRQGATWHVFAIYCDLTVGCDSLRRGLMHLTSTDLTHWTEVGYVLPPDNGSSWDSYDIWAPSIVERDGTYYMYYTGVQKNGSNTLVQKIGLATSTDLYTWTKSGSNPVVDCSTFTWGVYYNTADSGDGAACRDANVTWDPNEHQWVMSLSTRRTGSTPANIMTIALATSENLTSWRQYNYIAATDDFTSESSHIFTH
ncbi:MAG: family 43 glycosylhydrolase, partial [Candidatus Kerfeldbacteria bacterium]|nr:family 43 glycosylhydrolase [Candidatus Kerfeldbacteria bacterium]